MAALDQKIKREVLKAAEGWMAENLGAIIRKEAGIDLPDGVPLKPHQFVARIQRELYRYGYTQPDASAAGPRILSEFLTDERIKYGNRAYAWDAQAARTLAHEYELAHQ